MKTIQYAFLATLPGIRLLLIPQWRFNEKKWPSLYLKILQESVYPYIFNKTLIMTRKNV